MNEIKVSVKIDAQLFRDFAIFDTFRIKRRWKSPVLFALIMLAFSVVCYSMRQTAEQAVLLGTVLMTIGLGLPVVYFINFMGSIGAQVKKMKLETPQPVYTITLAEAPDGIEVVTVNGDTMRHDWESVYGVYRRKGCIYLYAQDTRAFLLPDKDVGDRAQALADLLQRQVPSKIH